MCLCGLASALELVAAPNLHRMTSGLSSFFRIWCGRSVQFRSSSEPPAFSGRDCFGYGRSDRTHSRWPLPHLSGTSLEAILRRRSALENATIVVLLLGIRPPLPIATVFCRRIRPNRLRTFTIGIDPHTAFRVPRFVVAQQGPRGSPRRVRKWASSRSPRQRSRHGFYHPGQGETHGTLDAA